MSDSATRPGQHPYGGPFNWGIALAVVVVAALEAVAVYGLLASLTLPLPVVAGLVGATGVVIVGSALTVCYRWRTGANPADESQDGAKSTGTRVAEVIVSITVVTVLAAGGAVLGLLLTVSAAVGGPDPETAEGDRLRTRLLDWIPRNRAFMRENGRGTLPLSP